MHKFNFEKDEKSSVDLRLNFTKRYNGLPLANLIFNYSKVLHTIFVVLKLI